MQPPPSAVAGMDVYFIKEASPQSLDCHASSSTPASAAETATPPVDASRVDIPFPSSRVGVWTTGELITKYVKKRHKRYQREGPRWRGGCVGKMRRDVAMLKAPTV